MCAMKIVTNSVSKNGTNTIPTNMTSRVPINFDNKNSAHDFKQNTFFVLII